MKIDAQVGKFTESHFVADVKNAVTSLPMLVVCGMGAAVAAGTLATVWLTIRIKM